MSATLSLTATQAGSLRKKPSMPVTRGKLIILNAQKSAGNQRRGRGYVAEDNSGKGNIFAVEPRQLYTSSPTSDTAARRGLGGQQGLLLVGGVIAVVVLVTVGQGLNPAETLQQAVSDAPADSLGVLATRIASSL